MLKHQSDMENDMKEAIITGITAGILIALGMLAIMAILVFL